MNKDYFNLKKSVKYGFIVGSVEILISFLIGKVILKSNFHLGAFLSLFIFLNLLIILVSKTSFDKRDRKLLDLKRYEMIPNERKAIRTNYYLYFVFAIVIVLLSYIILSLTIDLSPLSY